MNETQQQRAKSKDAEIFLEEDVAQGKLPDKGKPLKTGTEVDTIASTKLNPIQMERLQHICSEYGMTVYEDLQMHCLLRLLYEDATRDGRTVVDEVEQYIQTFTFDQEKAMQALGSLRRIFNMPTLGNVDGGIEYVIISRKGGVVEVYDPHDQRGMMGMVTGSIDKALEILLCERFSKFKRVIDRVKQERGYRSTFYAICRLLAEEYAQINHGVEDDVLGYAMNEYGEVPKQVRNTKQMQ